MSSNFNNKDAFVKVGNKKAMASIQCVCVKSDAHKVVMHKNGLNI